MQERLTSEALYAACRVDGSVEQQEAFAALWPILYRVAYAMLYEYPDGDAITSDCTQKALIKVHANLDSCQQPLAFREWCMQIVRRTVLDELRRPEHRRRASMPDADHGPWVAPPDVLSSTSMRTILQAVITDGPLSERSQRVVIGRYFEEASDDVLARREQDLSGKPVQPSHVQVTRAKNLAALRRDAALLDRLRDLLIEG